MWLRCVLACRLDELISPLVALGLRSVIIFGVPTQAPKDDVGSFATSEQSPVYLALQLLRKKYPSLLLMVDICLCAYTNTGHCGIMNADHTIDNQRRSDCSPVCAARGLRCICPCRTWTGS